MIDFKKLQDFFDEETQQDMDLIKEQVDDLEVEEMKALISAMFIALNDKNKLQTIKVVDLFKKSRFIF